MCIGNHPPKIEALKIEVLRFKLRQTGERE